LTDIFVVERLFSSAAPHVTGVRPTPYGLLHGVPRGNDLKPPGPYTLLAIVALALGVAAAFGCFAAIAPATFDWTAAAEAGTATGTLALAFVTGVLARLTYDEVQATRDEVKLTRSIEADRHRPTLVIANRREGGSSATDGKRYGSALIDLRNVGVGPAVGVRLVVSHPDTRVTASADPVVAIPPDTGQAAVISWSIPMLDPDPTPQGSEPKRVPEPRTDDFVIEGAICTDRTGTPVTDALLQ